MKNHNERHIRAAMVEVHERLGAATLLAGRIVTAICTDDINDEGLVEQHGLLVARLEDIQMQLRRMPVGAALSQEEAGSTPFYLRSQSLAPVPDEWRKELERAVTVLREIAGMGGDSTDQEIADEALRVARHWVATNGADKLCTAAPFVSVPEEWRASVQEFVDRCERGEIRSKRTYARFKALLSASQI